MIGIESLTAVQWVGKHSGIQLALVVAYNLLLGLVAPALVAPMLQGFYQRGRRYVIAVTFSVLLTAALFALVPAIGPWVVYGFQPTYLQSSTQAALVLLKSGKTISLDFPSGGIVSFPSFHVALVALSVAALWYIRKLRSLLCLAMLGICISTVTTGWHYVIDVIGGIGVAAISQAAAMWMLSYRPTDQASRIETLANAEVAHS
jgi:membrane-associated phospholipid phosphatase